MYTFLLTFKDLEVLECLQRPFDVKQYSMDIPNLGFPLEEEESAVKKRRLETKATTVHVTEREQGEDAAHVTESEQEEATAHVTESEQEEATAHVTEIEQEEGTVHVTESGQGEGSAHVTDEVNTAESHVAKVQRTSAYKRRKLVRPTLSSCAMYTAQPRKNIPGHTGYLTFATLHTKQQRSGATNEPSQ